MKSYTLNLRWEFKSYLDNADMLVKLIFHKLRFPFIPTFFVLNRIVNWSKLLPLLSGASSSYHKEDLFLKKRSILIFKNAFELFIYSSLTTVAAKTNTPMTIKGTTMFRRFSSSSLTMFCSVSVTFVDIVLFNVAKILDEFVF